MVDPVARYSSIHRIRCCRREFFPTPMRTAITTARVNDAYGQPRALFNLFDDGQKARLFSNIAEAMQGVPPEIVERQLGHYEKVHPDYAAGVRKALADLLGRSSI